MLKHVRGRRIENSVTSPKVLSTPIVPYSTATEVYGIY
jgi:hypothetical protein